MRVNLARDLRLKLTINGSPVDLPMQAINSLRTDVELDGLPGAALNLGGLVRPPQVTISELSIDLDAAMIRDLVDALLALLLDRISTPA